MVTPSLTRYVSHGVTLLGDLARPGGVTFAFTERTGGVSLSPYDALNLGSRCGDDPVHVARNRALALEALGAAGIAERVVEPKQVHGDHIVVVRSADEDSLAQVRAEALEGADAVVCTVPGVPVLLCFADCVPVVLVAPGAFAVVHSGWRGTFARISVRAVRSLCAEAGCDPSQVRVYLGPHIAGEDYEVSLELLGRFVGEFGTMVNVKGMLRNLSLSSAITSTLESAGVKPCLITDAQVSTASRTDRFFSYRAEGGHTGRHAAIAFLP